MRYEEFATVQGRLKLHKGCTWLQLAGFRLDVAREVGRSLFSSCVAGRRINKCRPEAGWLRALDFCAAHVTLPGVLTLNVHRMHRFAPQMHRFCVLCEHRRGHRLWRVAEAKRNESFCGPAKHDFRDILEPKSRVQRPDSSFHRRISKLFGTGTQICTVNTRYCGFVLTCTINSGIFSSAAPKTGLHWRPEMSPQLRQFRAVCKRFDRRVSRPLI